MKMVTASAATEDCSPVGQEDMQHLRKISSSFTKHLEMLADAAEQDIGPSGQTPSSPTHQVHAFDPSEEEESKGIEMKPQKQHSISSITSPARHKEMMSSIVQVKAQKVFLMTTGDRY